MRPAGAILAPGEEIIATGIFFYPFLLLYMCFYILFDQGVLSIGLEVEYYVVNDSMSC